MRKLFLIILSLATIITNAQTDLIITGKTYTNSDDTWNGVEIPRSQPVRLQFRNNSITSGNNLGYMLLAGDEGPTENDNNLKGAVITGNQLVWNGTDLESITHGIFTGHNTNVLIKYNNLFHVPMGLIRKSGNNMADDGGGVAYNIVRNGAVCMVVKGISNVKIYNNTFYTERTLEQTWRPLIQVYTNTDNGKYSVAHGTKIYNNILYTKFRTPSISVEDQESLKGLECDYNLYWCESGTPMFIVNGNNLTFAEWQQLGYDAHSVVMNPDFRDMTSFIPRSRLDYGTPLGSGWAQGLSVNATWGTGDPATAMQSGNWQVGAVIYGEAATPSSNIEIYPNPVRNYFIIKNTPADNLPEIIRIYDLNGRLCLEKRLETSFLERINVRLSSGVYILNVTLGTTGNKHVQKIVVVR
jgi:hypothetical protein